MAEQTVIDNCITAVTIAGLATVCQLQAERLCAACRGLMHQPWDKPSAQLQP